MAENNTLGMIHKQTTAFTKKLSQQLFEGGGGGGATQKNKTPTTPIEKI